VSFCSGRWKLCIMIECTNGVGVGRYWRELYIYWMSGEVLMIDFLYTTICFRNRTKSEMVQNEGNEVESEISAV